MFRLHESLKFFILLLKTLMLTEATILDSWHWKITRPKSRVAVKHFFDFKRLISAPKLKYMKEIWKAVYEVVLKQLTLLCRLRKMCLSQNNTVTKFVLRIKSVKTQTNVLSLQR